MNFNEIRNQISTFRERLIEFIDTIPSHAEGVTPLGTKGNCGIVNFSTLAKHKVMCADYYLNFTAKEELRHICKVTKLENFDKVIETLIQTGRIPYKPIKMNPAFIARLRDMWEKEMGVTIFLEHDVVVTTCNIDRKKYLIPESTQGTIIHLHFKKKELKSSSELPRHVDAFIVEFSEKRIVTVQPEEIAHVPKDD